jgi:hypothetical protein
LKASEWQNTKVPGESVFGTLLLKQTSCFAVNSFPVMVSNQIWDHSPHHFLVFGNILVNFGRKIKVDSVLETRESQAYAYSIAVYLRPIPLVSDDLRLKPQARRRFFC